MHLFQIGAVGEDDARIIHQGLKLYSKNCRAAAGTLKGLAKDDEAAELEQEADDVTERLMPKFAPPEPAAPAIPGQTNLLDEIPAQAAADGSPEAPRQPDPAGAA